MDTSMTEQVEGTGATAYAFANVLVVVGVIFNIFIFLPFLVFLSYTLAQILPALVAASGSDPPTYTQVPLSDLESDTPSDHAKTRQSSLFSPDLSLRPLLSQLLSHRTHFKYLALFRGLGIMILISVTEVCIVALGSNFFNPASAIVVQIIAPLALVQLYTLWTHTVLTHRSTKSLWQRMPPFKATLRATGGALAVVLTAKALARVVLTKVLGIDELNPIVNPYQPIRGGMTWAVGLCLTEVILMPANMILTRVQASLLPADDNLVVPLDEALRGDGKNGESKAVGLKDAWATFGWGTWRRLVILYVQIFVLVLVCGGGLFVADLMVVRYLVRLKNGTL